MELTDNSNLRLGKKYFVKQTNNIELLINVGLDDLDNSRMRLTSTKLGEKGARNTSYTSKHTRKYVLILCTIAVLLGTPNLGCPRLP